MEWSMLPAFVRYQKGNSSEKKKHTIHANGETTMQLDSRDLVNIPSFELKGNLLVNLNVSHNKIRDLPRLPDTIRFLDIAYNEIENIVELPRSLTNLLCGFNQLTTLGDLTHLKDLTVLACESNKLKELELPENMYFLNARYNLLENIDSFPDSIRYLNLCNNRIENIGKLPRYVEELNISDNFIQVFHTDLFDSTSHLKRFNCKGNRLENIQYLPSSLEYLYCCENRLTYIDLPSSLEYLYANDNQLTEFSYLPDSLKILFVYNNPMIYPFSEKNVKNIREYIREHEPLFLLK